MTAQEVSVPMHLQPRAQSVLIEASQGRWSIRAEVSGYWSTEAEVSTDDPSSSCELLLLHSTHIEGRLASAAGEAVVKELGVGFQHDRVRGETECRLSGRRFQCLLPAGELDQRFDAGSPWSPLYRWSLEAETGKDNQIGVLRLREGSLVTGRVEAEYPGLLESLADVRVELRRIFRGWLSDPREKKRMGMLGLNGTPQAESGKFQIAGVPDGSYAESVKGFETLGSRISEQSYCRQAGRVSARMRSMAKGPQR